MSLEIGGFIRSAAGELWVTPDRFTVENTGDITTVTQTFDGAAIMLMLGPGPYVISLPDEFHGHSGSRIYDWWIGVPLYPLRQIQRNDGLGRSVMRARGGTSVQGSNRQRGYR